MKKLSILAGAAFMATCFATGAWAVPTTIDFTSVAGDTGLQTKTYGGLITLGATYVTGADWNNGGGLTYLNGSTTLYERNDAPSDFGVGICNAGERGSCPNGGYYNEISSNINVDIMTVTVASGWKFVDMTLSSLDPADHFKLYGTNAANPDLPTLIADLSGDGTGPGGLNPLLSLASVSGFTTLYLTGGYPAGGYPLGNDFLLRSVSVDRTGGPGGQEEVPEPASLALLGAGLLGLGLAQRRRSRV